MILLRFCHKRRCATMMGKKFRHFAPLPTNLSLEELVPKDNFYRRLDRELDLSFVRYLVKECYASSGRPSVDPGWSSFACNWSCSLRTSAQSASSSEWPLIA